MLAEPRSREGLGRNPPERTTPERTTLGRTTLGQRASFWVAAGVVSHTLWTSAAPAMTYPLYAAQWGLTPATTTAIFAVYPVVVVAMLICFGDLSDHIGRRATMLYGLGASLAGVLLFAVAPNVMWIFVGRTLMGVGVGLSASPSTAAMVEFSPATQSKRASAITTMAQALGLASATLIGGGLIEYAPFPTRLNFWILFALIAALFAAAWFLPRHTAGDAAGPWTFKPLTVPKGHRRIFVAATTAVMTGYVIGGLILSLGAQIAHDLIGSGHPLVNGAALALFAIVWGAVAILARQMPPTPAVILGGIAAAASMTLLMLSAAHHALPLFLAATAMAGIGYSLLFLGGLTFINASAPPHHRGGTLSTLYFVAYLMQGVVSLLVGLAATVWGLQIAIVLGSVAIGAFAIAAILLTITIGTSSRTDQPKGSPT